jgi:glyoxylase-like metal-dependent hydrolase (beta-lactamase superfamily II)
MSGHVTAPVAALADELPSWVTLLRAPNPGPMTLDGTNTWVLRAAPGEPAVVVDPGPGDEGHLAAIAAHGPVGLVLITHGHPDHTEGSARLHELLGGVPVRAIDPTHSHGADPLTAAPLDLPGLTLRPVPTPGHTADSVCFLVEHGDERVVLTGDTILGRGTTVVAHPDGHLGDYLASLELLSAYRGIPALPGHGPALADCAAAADFYLAHRRARLDQVRAAVAAGARTAPEVVAAVYADVDRSLWWAAEWSVRAQLEYLGVGTGESGPGVSGLEHT